MDNAAWITLLNSAIGSTLQCDIHQDLLYLAVLILTVCILCHQSETFYIIQHRIVNMHNHEPEVMEQNWSGASTVLLSQLRRRKRNRLGHTLRRCDNSIAKQVLKYAPQSDTEEGAAEVCLEERAGKRNLDGVIQVQLEENGSSSTRVS